MHKIADDSPENTLRTFEPGIIVEGSVVGHDYDNHLHRSQSPGVDIDVTYDVDKLPRAERPNVMAPADGTLEFVGGKDGTIKIRDSNGYLHIMFHNDINAEVKVGQNVIKGQALAKESNVSGKKSISSHVHYSVYDPNTQTYLDPESLRYDETGAVDPESARTEAERRKEEKQVSDQLDKMIRDPNLRDKGTNFDSTKDPGRYGGYA
jgi:murein DD-endopeptidase MepM/ murein hydrolase activator NlpD